LAGLIIPENLNRCKPFFGNGGALPKSSLAFGRVACNPNGEAMSLAATLPAHLRPRREKVFGDGRPRPLDRNAKVRLITYARALMRRTEVGRHYGQVTAKAFAVLEALLWGFHNARDGRCFPSYETIAARAGCARSTVAEALKALEAAGILTWVNRLYRKAVQERDLLGQWGRRMTVMRTSNGYQFLDPKGAGVPESLRNTSKSDYPSGTPIQDLPSNAAPHSPPFFDPDTELGAALSRLKTVIEAKAEPK
jgi:biotin operon repressor